MAAHASHSTHAAAPSGSWDQPRGSSGPDRHSWPPLPHIDDLKQDGTANHAADMPLNLLLSDAQRSFAASRSSLDFARLDLAYKNYIRACDVAVNAIPAHADYGFWEHNRPAWVAQYRELIRNISKFDDQMQGVRDAIKDNNARHATRPRASSRPPSSHATSGAASSHTTSGAAGPSGVPGSSSSHVPAPLRSLQGRPLSQTADGPVAANDLSERFARLRGFSPDSGRLSGVGNGLSNGLDAGLTEPRGALQAPDALSGRANSPPDVTALQGLNVPPLQGRPNGPRDMPLASDAPPPALRPGPAPLAPAVCLPKPPSPAYSPIKPATAALQAHAPRKENRAGGERRQTYYSLYKASSIDADRNQAQSPPHAPGPAALSLQRTREELHLPYRPTTPNGVHSAVLAKSRSADIPHHLTLDPPTLQSYMAKYNVLVVDIRDRTSFDQGHILASSVICIEPLALREGLSAEDLEEGLVLSPDAEQALFARRNEFDVVVYYDQTTASHDFLSGPPSLTNAPALRAFHDTLHEFNYTKPLRDARRPVLLRGGLDAWAEYMGPQSLATSNTSTLLGSTRPRLGGSAAAGGRPLARRRIISSNTRLEVRNRRLRSYSVLDEQEARRWREQAQQEEPELHDDGHGGRQPADPDHVPLVGDGDEQTAVPVYSDPLAALPPRWEPPVAMPLPSVPTRPAPAIPRPSYSGQADLVQSQAPLARTTSSTRAPLYSSTSALRNRKLPRTGLTNFGVTCYMNSTLQCLSATLPLSVFFTNRQFEGSLQKNWKGSSGIMPKFYANLIQALWNDDCEAIKPTSFRVFCGRMNHEWVIDRQQDAKEFFDFLVDCLHEDLNVNWARNPVAPLTFAEEVQRERMQIAQASQVEWDRYEHRDLSFVSSLFAGQHASRLRCLACNNTSTTYEAFYSISIEIPRSGPAATIYDCLRSYTMEEKLDEVWRCPYCKCDREATKKIILTRLPDYLVIHFKRFASSRFERAKKIHTAIEFPLYGLSMDEFVVAPPYPPVPDAEGKINLALAPPYRYDAYAVIRHLGNTIDGGHYVSIVKDPGRGVWRKFDDEKHLDLDPNKLAGRDRLQNSEAYIVFFQRASFR
ncbi:hypothetical protein DV737_g1245, partial [Chaetothyriales sp. CBS 132003]